MAIKKSTRLLTNIPQIYWMFHTRRCDRTHVHCSIQGSEGGEKRSVWAQRYPLPMCDQLIEAFKAYVAMVSEVAGGT